MLPPGSPRPFPEIVFQMKFVAMDSITPTAKPTSANTVYGPAWRCVKLLVEALCNAAYEQFAAAGSITTPSRDAACNSSSCCKVKFASGPVQLQLSPCNHHQVPQLQEQRCIQTYPNSTCPSTVRSVKPPCSTRGRCWTQSGCHIERSCHQRSIPNCAHNQPF